MSRQKDQPRMWYQEGLRFECSQCGDCCTGAPGYVWVNQAEIDAMAARLGETREAFEQRYVRKIGIRKSLVEFSNGDCVFFDSASRQCKVYDVRPRQCRSWPFWNSNIRTAERWAETCAICPGSGRGPLIPVEEIERQRAAIQI